MATYLVCGATGFVGQHVVRHLIAHQHSVHVLTRDASRLSRFDWRGGVVVHEGDLSSPIELPNSTFDGLMFLAWEGLPNYGELCHFERNLPQSYAFIKQQVEAGTQQVVVSGTCLEYGMAEGALNASMKTDPQNAYALAKDMLHKQLSLLADKVHFRLSWARLFYLHGEGQAPSSLLPLLQSALDANETIFNMSGGEQLRDYLPVEEAAAQLCDLLVSKKGGVFNVCSGEPISVRRLIEGHLKAKGRQIKLNLGHYPYPEHEPMSFWGIK